MSTDRFLTRWVLFLILQVIAGLLGAAGIEFVRANQFWLLVAGVLCISFSTDIAEYGIKKVLRSWKRSRP